MKRFSSPAIIVALVALAALFGSRVVSAGSPAQSPATRPGECATNVEYTQRFQFMPTAWDTNEYLKFITTYQGCEVIISQGRDPNNGHEQGFFIWFKLPTSH